MDRAAYIASLKLDNLPIEALEAFYRGLPDRIPAGSDDAAIGARRAIERSLTELNAAMLGRDPDHRVPVDIDAIVAQITDRMHRYRSSDWERASGTGSLLDHARALVGEISADLRETATDEDWPSDDWADIDAGPDENDVGRGRR